MSVILLPETLFSDIHLKNEYAADISLKNDVEARTGACILSGENTHRQHFLTTAVPAKGIASEVRISTCFLYVQKNHFLFLTMQKILRIRTCIASNYSLPEIHNKSYT